MKMRFFVPVISILLLFGLTSCSAIFTGLYGMKKTRAIDEATIISMEKKFNIPGADGFELDTTYLSYLSSLEKRKYQEQIKNHYQPLQALYYDQSGNLKSFQINCFAGGFPNLNWERNEIMKTFPPGQQAGIDSIVPLKTQLKYLKPLSQTQKFSVEDYDYIVVVYWSRFMGRQSERFIRFIQNNRALEKEKKVKIIYANTDNLFANL
jgi:hypothetical protein